MEKERVEEIRQLGDTLANYVLKQNDKAFFRNFYRARYANEFRTLLLRANYRWVQAGHEPLIILDPYITVFEEGNEMMAANWKFARDLVLLRMIETLYKHNWFVQNADAFPSENELETATLESEIQQ